VQTNGNFLFIGAQQKTYLALRGNGTCWIISARNLKSSILHIKYNESSTVDNEIKISYNKNKLTILNDLSWLHIMPTNLIDIYALCFKNQLNV